MQDAINLHECPIESIFKPDGHGAHCGLSATHTIILTGHGPVDVCWTHAKANDAGQRLTIYTDAPARAASEG
jgi:hypothetical protein